MGGGLSIRTVTGTHGVLGAISVGNGLRLRLDRLTIVVYQERKDQSKAFDLSGKRCGAGSSEANPAMGDLLFKVLDRGALEQGAGGLINMTDRAVQFRTNEELTVGSRIEMSIEWPTPAEVTGTRRLIVHGTVARVENGKVSVNIHKYRE